MKFNQVRALLNINNLHSKKANRLMAAVRGIFSLIWLKKSKKNYDFVVFFFFIDFGYVHACKTFLRRPCLVYGSKSQSDQLLI